MASRAFLNSFRASALRQTRLNATRRTYAEAANIETPAQAQSGFQKIWNSPVGPKTVHFWAPIMKWGLVLAGASDFARPASQLSLTQNMALTCTGAIWTRWCFVIKPKNLFLASVNFLLFCVGATQTSRVLMYQSEQKKTSVGEELKNELKADEKAVERLIKDPKGAVKEVESPSK